MLLALIMVVTMLPRTALAADDVPAVTTNNSLITWTLDANGTLYITGSGHVEEFVSPDEQPWKDVREQIITVRFELEADMCIHSLEFWFTGCVTIRDIAVPIYVEQITPMDFSDCFSLVALIYGGVDVYDDVMPFVMITDIMTRSASAEDGLVVLSASNCGVTRCTCTGYCSFEYRNYRVAPESNNYHIMTVYCAGCGLTDGIIVTGSHSYGYNGYCSLCGYYNSAYDSTICNHYSTYRSWSGCYWYDYCSNCGTLVNSGISHGSTYTTWSGCYWYDWCSVCGQLMDSGVSHSYSSGSWQYYNSSQHSRTDTCTVCGAKKTTYGYHSTSTRYSPYSSNQHSYGSYCSLCGSYVGSVNYTSHNFSIGNWQSYSGTQHRRLKTCAACGYTEYEYANHTLSYGSWSNISATQHRRTVSCATCGHNTTETTSHDLNYSAWTNYSAAQHRRTVSCSSCEYSSYEYAAHSLVNGAWSSISDTQHQRTKTCSCGYSTTENGTHTDADNDGDCEDCGYMMARFSVTVPASLSLVVSRIGEVFSANNASIINNSTDAVEVTVVTVTAANGWTLVPFAANMANAKVDTKLIGFSLNGAGTSGSGTTENLSFPGARTISRNGMLPLFYDAVVSAMSEPVSRDSYHFVRNSKKIESCAGVPTSRTISAISVSMRWEI